MIENHIYRGHAAGPQNSEPVRQSAADECAELAQQLNSIAHDLLDFASSRLSTVAFPEPAATVTKAPPELRAPLPPYFEALRGTLLELRSTLNITRDVISRVDI